MFSNHSVPTIKLNPNLPIVELSKFTRDEIVLQLAVHSYGLDQQMQALIAVMRRCGLVAGRHFLVVQPDVKTLQATLITSQQRLFAIHFIGAGQVLHAMLCNFQNFINITSYVPDPRSTSNITCRDTSNFPALINDLLLRYNDNELLIPCELFLVHNAHRQAFNTLYNELVVLHEAVALAKSSARDNLQLAINALAAMGEDADANLLNVSSSRYVALVAALCRACRLANEEKPGFFDRATKEADLGKRYFKLFKKYAELIPSDLNPLQQFKSWGDVTSSEDKIKQMNDSLLKGVYEKIVAPALRQDVRSGVSLGK